MSNSKKQIRQKFRNEVFERDDHRCVIPGCNLLAQDAHHIIERALWKHPSELGGYLVDNGVGVCKKHHIHAEKDFFPPQALRIWAGITNLILPKGFDQNELYTKWGKVVKKPTRQDWESIKYPHTPYLNFTEGVDELDVRKAGYMTVEKLVGKPLIVTIKMDGSNALLVRRGVAGRNASTATHNSFSLLKAKHSMMSHLIPKHLQVFGEWLYAKHSIHYVEELSIKAFFQIFAIYNRKYYMWLSWADVRKWANILGFQTVSVVKEFECDNPAQLQAILTGIGRKLVLGGHEGFVLRNKYPFYYGQFADNVGKYVRVNHVTTDKHWTKQKIIRNKLKF